MATEYNTTRPKPVDRFFMPVAPDLSDGVNVPLLVPPGWLIIRRSNDIFYYNGRTMTYQVEAPQGIILRPDNWSELSHSEQVIMLIQESARTYIPLHDISNHIELIRNLENLDQDIVRRVRQFCINGYIKEFIESDISNISTIEEFKRLLNTIETIMVSEGFALGVGAAGAAAAAAGGGGAAGGGRRRRENKRSKKNKRSKIKRKSKSKSKRNRTRKNSRSKRSKKVN